MPLVEIINLNDEKMISRSPKSPNGTADWQQVIVEFAAPANCNGISVRTVREFCGEDCPISGILWYDNFELIRL
jgi:hypothetical protein